MSQEAEAERVKADAVAALRAALLSGQGVADAVRVCWYRNPLFASTLMSESLRLRFAPGCDLRLVTAFVARIRAVHGEGFPGREAEAVIRACLGETGLLDAVHPGRLSYPEIGIAVLDRLFAEWHPDEGELREWFGHVERATAEMTEASPSLRVGEADWFAEGMHELPFAAPQGETWWGEEG
jgi:hypothetical protein